VKRIIAYILLSIFLLHNTTVDQLLKLPTLVIHYQEHHLLNQDLTVADFLCMHYIGDDDKDDDYDRDMQLPYKSVNVQVLQHAYVPLAKVMAERPQFSSIIAIHYPVLKQFHLPEPALTSLFRPPQA